MDIIQELCKKYTDLTDEEIATINAAIEKYEA